MEKTKPDTFIQAVRESDLYIKNIYLSGGCYQFFKILKTVFVESEPYINETKDHVVTKIRNEFYDITGVVKGKFSPLEDEEIDMCEKWSFSKNYWLYRECPNCEEPVFAQAEH